MAKPNDTPRFLPAGEELCDDAATVPYFLAEHSIELIRRFAAEDKPFFIWNNIWGPHGPYYAPTKYVDVYRNAPIPEWANYRWPARTIPGPHHCKLHPLHEELGWEAWETMIRYYYAFTTLIDAQIGRIIDALKENGTLDNTIVMFAADHGETIGSHGGTMRTIRCGDLKYGFNCSNGDELYDLRWDPNETENLVDHPNY